MIFVNHSTFFTFKRDGRKGLSEGKADVEMLLEMKFLQKY